MEQERILSERQGIPQRTAVHRHAGSSAGAGGTAQPAGAGDSHKIYRVRPLRSQNVHPERQHQSAGGGAGKGCAHLLPLRNRQRGCHHHKAAGSLRRRERAPELGTEGPHPVPHLCRKVRCGECFHRQSDRHLRGEQHRAGCRRPVRVRLHRLLHHRLCQRDFWRRKADHLCHL